MTISEGLAARLATGQVQVMSPTVRKRTSRSSAVSPSLSGTIGERKRAAIPAWPRIASAVFTGIGPAGALNPGAFVVGTAAGDADDRIIYNSATGQLSFDADGSGAGAAVMFATLTGAPALAASDFQVI